MRGAAAALAPALLLRRPLSLLLCPGAHWYADPHWCGGPACAWQGAGGALAEEGACVLAPAAVQQWTV